MFKSIGLLDLALIASILAIFVFRIGSPPARIISALHTASPDRPRRSWRDWTLSERLTVVLLAFIGFQVYRAYQSGSMAGVGLMLGFVLVIVVLKGLWARSRAT